MNRLIFLSLFAALGLSACNAPRTPETAATPPQPSAHEQDGDAHEDAEHEEEKSVIQLSDEQIKDSAIVLAAAGSASIQETLPLYGVVIANAERTREVVARFPGVIRMVNKRLGDAVKQGEVMARVEGNESLQTYALLAPISGTVTLWDAGIGEQTADKTLFGVTDLSTVWVELALFPRDVAKVKRGAKVIVSAPEHVPVTGEIVYLAPFGSSGSQTITARVLIDNQTGTWTPGLYVSADVLISATEVPLAIANSAVQTIDGVAVVFVQSPAGFSAQAVQLGRSDGLQSAVQSGLKAGDVYVAGNSFLLKAELGKGAAEHGH